MSILQSQGITLSGHAKFLPLNNDYEYFIYDGYVFDIKDFVDYQEVDLDFCDIDPVCTIEEWNEVDKDNREYYNYPNLYGPGKDINLVGPEISAVLITNAKGF